MTAQTSVASSTGRRRVSPSASVMKVAASLLRETEERCSVRTCLFVCFTVPIANVRPSAHGFCTSETAAPSLGRTSFASCFPRLDSCHRSQRVSRTRTWHPDRQARAAPLATASNAPRTAGLIPHPGGQSPIPQLGPVPFSLAVPFPCRRLVLFPRGITAVAPSCRRCLCSLVSCSRSQYVALGWMSRHSFLPLHLSLMLFVSPLAFSLLPLRNTVTRTHASMFGVVTYTIR